MKAGILFVIMGMLSISVFVQAQDVKPDADIKIKVDNVVAIALGEGATSSIAIGGLDGQDTNVQLDIGSILYLGFGDGAEAVIQLPKESRP
ncbi:hypothetical protein [Candidatus Venteria ishoeyi]|uniref:Pilus formation protein N-terminal domain-containing protein n=1 Tax=Candidatus Venteria ishoeyi TaxID=1899563 RepID=A0A1H6F3L0_9GAMM|nr:hypothetical protein [Candidatus Venteria ishoeyi]SEH04758.1 Uncharacterised protein [Candidatus Venteria ishoeyi]